MIAGIKSHYQIHKTRFKNLTESECENIINAAFEVLDNTTKQIVARGTSKNVIQEMIKMCGAVVGSIEADRKKPFVIIYVGVPFTPFTHPKDSLEKLCHCCNNNIPAINISDTQLGSLSPETQSGSLVVGLAEIIARHVISQLPIKEAFILEALSI